MTDTMWFYEKLAEQTGPVSVQTIYDRIADGTLSNSDRVRQDGDQDWITVAEMPGQQIVSDSQLEELGDLSELSFTFGDSGFSPLESPQDSSPPPSVPPLVTFQIKSQGHISESVSFAELVQLAKDGKLLNDDMVRTEDAGEWQTPLAIAQKLAGVTITPEAEPAPHPVEPAKVPRPKTPSKPKRRKQVTEAAENDLPEEVFHEVFGEQSPEIPQQPSLASHQPATLAESESIPTTVIAEPAEGVPPASRPSLAPRTVSKPSWKSLIPHDAIDRVKLPTPKVLGMIVAGFVAVLLIGGTATGLFTLPGFAPDVDGFIESTVSEYRNISADPIPLDRWAALKAKVSEEGRVIVRYYARFNDFSEQDNKRRWAVAKLIELLACDPNDPEKIKSVFEEYERLHGK